VACNKCHDRFCKPCGNERSRVIAHNVRAHLADRTARFLTLTLRAQHEPLADACTRLTRSFARLRSRALWKTAVTGGVAFLEIKRAANADRWHAHLHVIIEGKYIPKDRLSKLWKHVTGDSFIVDIKLVKNVDQVAKYVTKYASKPLDPSLTRSPDDLLEAIHALHNRRLCITFGDWRGVDLTAPVDDGEWDAIAPLASLLTKAASGDPEARRIIHALRSPEPCQTRAPPDQLLLFETTLGT